MSKKNIKQFIFTISIEPYKFFAVLYFSASFIYILWKIDPSLYYQCQIPVFLCDKVFFQKFLQYPGGLAEYASNFLSQFYYFPLIGSLIITACLVAISALSFFIAKVCAPNFKFWALHYLPPLLLLMMFSQYEHRLTNTLGLLAAVLAFFFYLKQRPKRFAWHLLLFVIQAVAVYFFSAGFLLLYAALCIFYEIFFHRSFIFCILAAAFTILVPYAAQAFVFILTIKSAYFFLLVPIYQYRPAIAPYLLFAYFPIVLIIIKFNILQKIRDLLPPNFNSKIVMAALLFFTAISAILSFDPTMNTVLRVDRYARNNQWERLLHFVKKHPSDDVLVAFHTNRALVHTNRMSSEMFSYNQNWGEGGLYLPPEARNFFSFQVADFYWDMGFLNEAQHWVLEDHSRFENSPWHLQRLALINIIKGEKNLALMALNALDRTILYRSWADHYRRYIKDPHLLANDSYLQNILKMNVKNDFIINPSLPGQDVETIASQQPANRIAGEYLIADYLLTFRLGEFMNQLNQMKEYDYIRLPRHYQEAMLVFFQNSRQQNITQLGRNIELQTRQEFNDFMRILANHQGNALAAQKELGKKYRNTYWYYSLFNNPQIKEDVAAGEN